MNKHLADKIFAEDLLLISNQSLRQYVENRLAVSAIPTAVCEFGAIDLPEPQQFGSQLVIPVYGILGMHLSESDVANGGCSVDVLKQWIDAAQANTSVSDVIFDFRCPGGTVTGLPETAAKILALNQYKRVVAYTNSVCASGGLWLASQAREFYCAESARVGSVGCFSVYMDLTEAMKAQGIKVNAIVEGKFKMTGASFQAMSDEEKGMLQARAKAVNDKFKAALLNQREIDPACLEGQTYDGDQAVQMGFCDAIVDDLADLLD